MYSVSAAYLAALALPVHKYRLTGTVGTEAFNEANIVSGSLSVSNKVSEGSEIKLGSVYTGELKGKFTGMSIARGAWVGKTITLSEGLLIDATNDTYEDVPLGIFTVAEANHTAEGVEVTAYDAMTAFDKTRNDLTDTGTAYAFLTLMCQKCGVTLGSTLADIQALPNGTETFTIYAENDIETWRDLLSWIAQTLGAVATIGRDGKLYLRQYSMTAAATIDETHRFTGCSFSDFTTYYTGMSVVNIALRQTEYKSEVVDDGLTYNLGSNPLVQGHYEYVQEIIDDFSNVALTPFNAQMLGGAIYDLCDCLTFSGGIAAGATCGVMGYTWKYNGAYSVKGFGANPALATAKSKTQKELEALYNTVGQDINEMSVVQNSTAVTIAENTETSILTYNFEVTQEENTTMIDVSVVVTATATETLAGEVYTLADLVAQLRFYVDNSQVTVYDPTFIVDEGKDTMTFNYSLSGLSVGAHEFDIRLEMSGGSGSVAVGDVHEMLWGYGITFEVYVKSIEVVHLPNKTTFYVGQNLDYDGLEVDAVFNNGITGDVTSQCNFYPAEGTTLTDSDIGTLTVDVSRGNFSTDFDLTIRKMSYKVVVGDYGQAITNAIDQQTIVIGSSVFAIGLKASQGSSSVRITIAKFKMENGRMVKDGTTADITDAGLTGQHYVCGCRKGETWYSMFEKNATTGYFFITVVSQQGTGSYSPYYYYVPDDTKTVTFFYLESYGAPYAYNIDNIIVFPKAWVKVDGTSIKSVAWLDGENFHVPTIRVAGEDTYDDILVNNRIMQSDGNNGLVGSDQNCLYPMKYFYDLNNGTLSIYQAHCDLINGVSKTLVGTVSTNLTSLSTAHCRQILESNVLLLADYTALICGVYDVDNHTYREFSFRIEEGNEPYMTVSNMGRILWNPTREVYFLPKIASGNSSYQLYRSEDLTHWEIVEKTSTDSYLDNIGNLANFGNYIVGNWEKDATISGSTRNAYYENTLEFTDSE